MKYIAVGKHGNNTRENDMLGACQDYWDAHGKEDLDVYEARQILPPKGDHPGLVTIGRKVTRMLHPV